MDNYNSMNPRYFTKERVLFLLVSATASLLLFMPTPAWIDMGVVGIVWMISFFQGLVLSTGAFLLLKGGSRAVAFIGGVMDKRLGKKKGALGELIDASPTALLCSALIYTGSLVLSLLVFLLAVGSVMIASVSENFFYKLEGEDQKNLIKLIRNK